MACVHDPSILVLKQESASVVFKSITVALPNIFLRALRLKIMYGTALYIYIYAVFLPRQSFRGVILHFPAGILHESREVAELLPLLARAWVRGSGVGR